MSEPTYNDWRLVLLTTLPTWLLIVASVAVLFSLWRALGGLSAVGGGRRRRWTLSALRIAAAVLLLLLLLEPGLERLSTRPLKARVAVLLDRSLSMRLPSAPNGPTRGDAARAVLSPEEREALGQRFQVDYFRFAETLEPVDGATAAAPAAAPEVKEQPGTPSPVEASTDIGTDGAPSTAPDASGGAAGEDPSLAHSWLLPAVEEAARAGGSRPLAGVVLLSDGADNGQLAQAAEGKDAELAANVRQRLRDLEAPVFAVNVAESGLVDLAVQEVKADSFAFVRSKVSVEVQLAARGLGEREVPVTLERDGQPVQSATATLGADGRGAVSFSFVPDTTGEFAWVVRVPVQPGEAVVDNNSRAFVLKVIRDRVRVLHVAGRPSWDERFLRHLLKRDANVDLISFFILRTPGDLTMTASSDELSLIPFPTDEIFREQLRTFDLVIFQDFTFRPFFMAQYLPGIADYVREGGAFLMVGGGQSFAEGGYGDSPIAEILPVGLDAAGPAPDDQPLQPRVTPTGRRHPITSLAASEEASEKLWQAMPPLHGLNRTRTLPDTVVLMEHPSRSDAGGQPLPVVAVREVGRGRSMAVTSDETWRWGFHDAPDARPQRAYEQFFHQAIRWLVRDPELTPVRVSADQERSAPERPVTANVQARTRDYGPAAGASVELTLQQADTPAAPARQLTATAGPEGTAALALGRLSPGAYRLTAIVRLNDAELGRAEDLFVVEGDGPERQQPAPRPDLLEQLARETGGEVVPAAGLRLSQLPLKDPRQVEVGQRDSRPVWDSGLVLLAICTLMATEWLLRRRWGLA